MAGRQWASFYAFRINAFARGLYRRTLTDPPLARRIGSALSAILVEQHTCISEVDVAGWLPTRPVWPEPGDRIRQSLPEMIDDRAFSP